MGTKLRLFIILTLIFKCNGHVPILGDILSGAHNVLGGLAQGLHVNFGGQFDLKNKPPPPPPEPEKTVIVVVQGEGNGNDHGPNSFRPPDNTGGGPGSYENRPYQQEVPNQYGYTHHGHHHNINRPYGQEGPHNNYNNNYGDGSSGNHEYYPHHGHKYPNHPHQNNFNRPNNNIPGNNNQYNNHNTGYNNYDYSGGPNEGNYYGNKPMRPNHGNNNLNGFPTSNEGWSNQPSGNQGNNNFNGFTTPNEGWSSQPSGNQGNNNFNGFTTPNEGWSKEPSENQGNNNNNELTTPKQSFTSEFATRDPIIQTNKPDKVTQKQPQEDAPLFVPLNLTETDSGKTNTDPKREVENKDDEEFDIDIRIKN